MQSQAPGRSPVADSLSQAQGGNDASSKPPLAPPAGPPLDRIVSALVLLAFILFGGLLLFRAPHNGLAMDPEDKELSAANLFKAWPRTPDLAIVFTGESKGYLQPCGCSEPQYGGLARRANLLHILKAAGWKAVAMDLGDMTQSFENKPADGGFHGFPEMTDIKFRTSMLALEKMGYGAVALGKQEYLAPLHETLGRHTVNRPQPRVVATNLIKTEPGKLWAKSNVAKSELITVDVFKIGVISIVGPTISREIADGMPPALKGDVNFDDPARGMADGLLDLKQKDTNIGVMLFQGDEKEAANFVVIAHNLYKAGKAPLLHAVLVMDRDSDPPDRPKAVGAIPTQIISVGHKGKNVGVLGLFRNPKNLELRYQNIKLGPQFQPKKGDEAVNPVVKVMQDYADELKGANYLGKIPRTMHAAQAVLPKAAYVGSERCGKCHDQIYADWQKTAHAHAYETLENAVQPKGRQFDPECIVCHTVGYPYQTGYFDPPTKDVMEPHNLKLRNVGCESCHGPGSEHVKAPNNAALYPIINPFRPSDDELNPEKAPAVKKALFDRRKNQIDWFCQKCHDLENDVNWGVVGFQNKYEGVQPKHGGGRVIHLDPGPPPSRGHEAWEAARRRGQLGPASKKDKAPAKK